MIKRTWQRTNIQFHHLGYQQSDVVLQIFLSFSSLIWTIIISGSPPKGKKNKQGGNTTYSEKLFIGNMQQIFFYHIVFCLSLQKKQLFTVSNQILELKKPTENRIYHSSCHTKINSMSWCNNFKYKRGRKYV